MKGDIKIQNPQISHRESNEQSSEKASVSDFLIHLGAASAFVLLLKANLAWYEQAACLMAFLYLMLRGILKFIIRIPKTEGIPW